MRDSQLAAACVVLAVLGIIALVFFAKTMQPEKVELNQLSEQHVGRLVQVSGAIVSVSARESVTTVKICSGSSCASVVLFKGLREKLAFTSFEKNGWLTVTGVVSEYKGVLEITPWDALSVDVS